MEEEMGRAEEEKERTRGAERQEGRGRTRERGLLGDWSGNRPPASTAQPGLVT